MEKIDLEVDDFISYCDYKGLSTKTISSYEQTFCKVLNTINLQIKKVMLYLLYK